MIHEKIQEAIRNKKLVLFIGSGFSKNIGLPDWRQLIEIISNRLNINYPDEILLQTIHKLVIEGVLTEIEAFDKLAKKHRTKVKSLLKELIDVDLYEKNLDQHRKLWDISDKIITTNFDKALEISNKKENFLPIIYNEHSSVAQLSNKEYFLFKIHGCISNPEDCIIFSEQYTNMYDQKIGAAIKLFTFLDDSVILFLGFSLSDPDINKLLSLRNKSYRGHNDNLFILTTQEKDFSNFGVQSVLIKDYNKSLDDYLDSLCEFNNDEERGYERFLRDTESKKGKLDYDEEKILRKGYFELLQTIEGKNDESNILTNIKEGKIDEAEEKLKKVFDSKIELIKNNQIKASEDAYYLGKIKTIKLEYNEAIFYLLESIKLNPNSINSYNELGNIYIKLGKPQVALDYFETCLKELESDNPKNILYILSIKNNIGSAHKDLGKFEKSLQVLNEAENYIDKVQFLKEDKGLLASIFNEKGAVLNKLGQHELSKIYYLKAIEIGEKHFGVSSNEVATYNSNLGTSIYKLGDRRLALYYFEKAKKNHVLNFGNYHPSIAIDNVNIATVFSDSGDYENSDKLLEESIKMLTLIYGKSHPRIADCKNNIGINLIRQNKLSLAKQYLDEALDIDLECV